MFRVFDEDNDGNLNMKEWVCGLSKLLRGTLDEQIDCMYLSMNSFNFDCYVKPIEGFYAKLS